MREKRDKKEQERFLVEEFLACRGRKDARVTSLDDGDAPDVEVLDAGDRYFVEVTRYQADQEHGSQGRRAVAAVESVLSRARQLAIERSPSLRRVEVHLSPNCDNPVREKDKGTLAALISEIVVRSEATLGNDLQVIWRPARQDSVLLRNHVRDIFAWRWSESMHGEVSRWFARSAAHIAFRADLVVAIVQRKAQKHRKRADSYQPCSLLICADGSTPFDGASVSDDPAIRDPQLAAEAQGSGFGSVFFWERVLRWYIDLASRGASARSYR